MHKGHASHILDSGMAPGMPLHRVVTFCGLTGMTLDEFARRVGLPATRDDVQLQPIDDPPIPTVRIGPAPDGARGRWLLLAHVNVPTRVLKDITQAFDNAAVDVSKVKAP